MPEHKSLKSIPGAQSSARFEEKYPIDKWLNGSVWELIPGKDFSSTPESFFQAVKAYAKRTNQDIQVAMRKQHVWVQAQKKASAPRRSGKKGTRRR